MSPERGGGQRIRRGAGSPPPQACFPKLTCLKQVFEPKKGGEPGSAPDRITQQICELPPSFCYHLNADRLVRIGHPAVRVNDYLC